MYFEFGDAASVQDSTISVQGTWATINHPVGVPFQIPDNYL